MNRIANRFNRASLSYDENAEIQKQLGQKLLSLYKRTSLPNRILELGCGTGLFSQELWSQFPNSEIWCTDLAPKMLEANQKRHQSQFVNPGIGPKVHFQRVDGFSPASPIETSSGSKEMPWEKPFQLIASNALVQWFSDLEAHIQNLNAILNHGGDLLVSGFDSENLWEMRRSFQRLGKPTGKPVGHSAEMVQQAIENQGFILKAWHAEEVRHIYSDPMQLFRSLSGLGATARPDSEPLSPRELKQLVLEYQGHYRAPGGGVTATWSTWAAWVIKP